MADIFSNVYEIYEVIVVVFLFLVISAAIVITSNPHYLQAQATATELSYASTLIGDRNFQVDLSYEDTKLRKEGNLIVIEYKDVKVKKNYFGSDIQIEEIEDNKYRLTTIS
ncbi:MAG: hypothetical protein PF569_03010 [Candidatus Woesearchaeota archaeon]|jgi:uncharacterized membrane protein|nr:hypothetical protein [Candidatus Woesearchaeota archaeon]